MNKRTDRVTEPEWLSCSDPRPMLEFLRGRASERKLRLFAVACFERFADLLPDSRQRHGIEILAQVADGTISQAAYRNVTAAVRQAIPPDDWVAGAPPIDSPHFVAL